MLLFFFFNDTATTEIYTLSLHDALPISHGKSLEAAPAGVHPDRAAGGDRHYRDRKSTRLNSSHSQISYAVFCLKKKNTEDLHQSKHGMLTHFALWYVAGDESAHVYRVRA